MGEVAVIIGSLRKDSYTRQFARAALKLGGGAHRFIEIGDLPLYNQDLEADAPAAWKRFRDEVHACTAVLFFTPEYNRSIPGCLKNALDVGSKPDNASVWSGKPAGVVSVTPYSLGAFGANHALRQTFAFLNMPVMQQPEAYVGNVRDLLDANGDLKKPEFMQKFMGAFAEWTRKFAAGGGDFDAFMKAREEAAAAYVRGDAKPLDALLAREGDATFLPPSGGVVIGADKVAARYDRDAAAFSPQGKTHFEVVQSASGDLAFWTGYQHAEASLGGQPMKSMKLRITEVYRQENGAWKLVHRHADPLAEREEKKS